MNTSDIISSIQVIVSILTFFGVFFPILLRPDLQYEVTDNAAASRNGIETLKVNIHNYGGATANNVQISMAANFVKFLNASSYPYQKLTIDNSTPGMALVQIGNLAPLLYETVIVNINNTSRDRNQPLTTFVKSDETGGYSTWGNCGITSCRLSLEIGIIVGFVALLIIALLLVWIMVKGPPKLPRLFTRTR